MRRLLRVGAVTLAPALAVMACNQILGTNDLEVTTTTTDAAPADASPAPTVPNDVGSPPPVDANAPPPHDAGASMDVTVPKGPSYPDGSVVWDGNGHAYLVGVTDVISWDDANAIAIDAGGHLATVTTAEENAFVVALAVDAGGYPQMDGPWLGAYQPAGSDEPAGGWTWVTGEPWDYTNWADGEPNNGGGDENYLGYYGDPSDAPWNDYADDNGGMASYVVEFE